MATAVRAASAGDSEEEEGWGERERECHREPWCLWKRQGIWTQSQHWNWVAATLLNVRAAHSTVSGMQFQLGLEISGLVGHVYPCVRCVRTCVRLGRARVRVREMKPQRRHTPSLTLSACSFRLHVCACADEPYACLWQYDHPWLSMQNRVAVNRFQSAHLALYFDVASA